LNLRVSAYHTVVIVWPVNASHSHAVLVLWLSALTVAVHKVEATSILSLWPRGMFVELTVRLWNNLKTHFSHFNHPFDPLKCSGVG